MQKILKRLKAMFPLYTRLVIFEPWVGTDAEAVDPFAYAVIEINVAPGAHVPDDTVLKEHGELPRPLAVQRDKEAKLLAQCVCVCDCSMAQCCCVRRVPADVPQK